MNRNLVLLALSFLLMPLISWAQNPGAIVHGTVTHSGTGAAISGAAVFIQADSMGFWGGYSAIVITDANGAYADTILSPANGTGIHASTSDSCSGVTLIQNFTYALGTVNNFTANFAICANTGPACNASFTYQTTPGATTTQFTSTSTGSNPNTPLTYNWLVTDANGNTMGTSTLASPAWSLSAGTYTVCLSIADGTGCTDSDCQSVVISGTTGNCMAGFMWVANGLTVQFIDSSVVGTGAQYLWTFMNTTSSLQNPSFTFPQAGTYTVCLTVSDASGCSDTYCQTITVGGGGVLFNTLDVTVSAVAPGTFAPDTFMVYVIQYDSVAGTLTAVDSATAVQGPNGGLASCSFANLSGSYLVKAAVSTVNSPNYATSIPTYYTNSLFWSTGTYVNLPSTSPTSIGINMIQGVNPGGPGFIGGMVSQGANKTGIPNVEIMLLDMNDNPITYTYTNGSGSFNFPNLAYGTYKVYAEVTGKPTTPAIVTISAAAPSAGSVEVSINSTNVTTALSHNVFFENNMKLYPNPANDMTTLQVELKQNSNIEVEISNMFGQLVERTNSKLSSGLNNLSINVNNLQSGVYFVKVIANGAESEIQKLIVE